MYSFECEAEMMTLLAVFNKAVASVVMAEGFKHMHLHDYHGASLTVVCGGGEASSALHMHPRLSDLSTC